MSKYEQSVIKAYQEALRNFAVAMVEIADNAEKANDYEDIKQALVDMEKEYCEFCDFISP